MPGEVPIIKSLQGKRVLVTGGSAGIGKATALQFDANGCTVAVLGRRLERLEAVVKQMKHGHSVVGDLTQAHDMERAVKEAIEKMGGLDILINNGGATNEEMMKGKGEEAYLAAFRLHVTGNLALIRAAEEELIKNKGAIVNVSSIAAQMPMPNFSAYSVAKAASDSLTQNLAFEFAPKGVRVNSVLPGTIDTEVFDSMATESITKAQVLEKLAKHHAMARVAAPEEVAAPIVFLASDSASFITGANLPVDGGALLGHWMNRAPIIERAE